MKCLGAVTQSGSQRFGGKQTKEKRTRGLICVAGVVFALVRRAQTRRSVPL